QRLPLARPMVSRVTAWTRAARRYEPRAHPRPRLKPAPRNQRQILRYGEIRRRAAERILKNTADEFRAAMFGPPRNILATDSDAALVHRKWRPQPRSGGSTFRNH